MSNARAAVWRAPVLLALCVVVFDQLAKHWAVTGLGPDRVIDVVWTLRWNLAFNSGMAFSRGQGFGPLIAVVATVVIVWLLVTLRTESSRLSTFGMGLLIGGAAGNLVDRAFRGEAWLRGAVVDFIDFQWFPIFNIADTCINVGAGVLILNSVLSARRANRLGAAEFEEARTGAAAADASNAIESVTVEEIPEP
ncbi:signal peptidase II [Ilumatobacter sp.]|uniref:signal peptidase II n=1 Tax=Ilumatobacter sp. TaxID=1967498 RepID=UPI003752EFA3